MLDVVSFLIISMKFIIEDNREFKILPIWNGLSFDLNVKSGYIYIDNVPEGNIPFISAGLGQNFSDFRGLIPGVLSNLNALNPYKMMQAFFAGSKPDCQPIELQTIDINNNKSTETHYMALIDIQNMDPCSFPKKTNPITKAKCKQGFTTLSNERFCRGDRIRT